MSKESARIFIEKLANSASMQIKFEKRNTASLGDVVAFAQKAGLSFTEEELKETLTEMGAMPLSEEMLEKISAGAFPTAVNDQITDAVT